MRFGYFDDAAREYVITTPKTPYPWINYLGSEQFFGLISHQSGGYCFYRDAKLRRLTRYRYNNVPTDSGGRYFYIREEDGQYWSPGYMPVKTELDSFECRHGMGYTQITGTKNDLSVETLFLVPVGVNCEVHRVRLSNNGKAVRKVKLFSFLEFCLWNAHDDATNLQRNLNTGEVEVVDGTIYHKTEYRERRDHFSFYHVNKPVAGFDTDRESFVGLYNGYGTPDVVAEGKSKNTVASGWAPIASHCLEVELAPGESTDYCFVLGYIENPEEEKWESKGIINKKRALQMINQFDSTEKVDAAMKTLRDNWTELLSKFSVQSSDEKLDRMVNIWNQYQCMVTFNMSRSASYFETGIGRGMGFRDSNQDLLGFVHMVPERARERIIDIASTQFPDGSAYHQYQSLTKRGNNDVGSGFNDDPLWLIQAVSAYMKESGDVGILDASVPFDNDENNRASLLEHCKRSFDHVLNNLGPHQLPLIGRADWNDCLNLNCFSATPDESYQTTGNREGRTAESVFIAGMFCFIGPMYVEIVERRGDKAEAERARQAIAAMEASVIRDGWDGEWYLRAYDFFGKKIGSDECEEGKIYIEPQGFCAMAEIGKDQGLPLKALDSVKERLDSKYGIVLVNPAYTKYHLELGEISSYPPGYKENAGIFCHNNPWVSCAEAIAGRPERAFEYYKKIAPAYLEEISEIHRTEPYVYSQMVAGKDADRHGEAKNSWLTGTAAWNFVAATQYLLGIRPEFDGLFINPCLPAEFKEFTITRSFRGASFVITVKNSGSGGKAKLEVDGKAIEGQIVPLAPAGSTVKVSCTV